MAQKKTTDESERTSDDDLEESLAAAVARLERRFDQLRTETIKSTQAMREELGRLSGRQDTVEKKLDKLLEEWGRARKQMELHHAEQSDGATKVGAATRKMRLELDELLKTVKAWPDPHVVLRPARTLAAEAGQRAADAQVAAERAVEKLREEVTHKLSRLTERLRAELGAAPQKGLRPQG